jgi:hypothetical protein
MAEGSQKLPHLYINENHSAIWSAAAVAEKFGERQGKQSLT